jgi:hypothetical protein
VDDNAQRKLEGAWSTLERAADLRNLLATLLFPNAFEPAVSLTDRVRTARYARSLSPPPRGFAFPGHLREWALQRSPKTGLFLEFGVANGHSTRHIAQAMREWGLTSRLFGFDSFHGLPEPWSAGRDRGAFAQDQLPAVDENTTLVVGRFEDTLPGFLGNHPEVVAFAHLDCDVYSSAHFVLRSLLSGSRLVENSVVLFDELVNYPGWSTDGEYRALTELLPNESVGYEVIGMVPNSTQVAVRIRERAVTHPSTSER